MAKRIEVNGHYIDFTCTNNRFRTDISTPINSKYPGSHTLEPLYDDGEDRILLLEKVVDTTNGNKCFWFMWYSYDGTPLLNMSGVMDQEDLQKAVESISKTFSASSRSSEPKEEETYLKKIQNKYEDIKIIAIGIILLALLGFAVKFHQDMGYIKEKFGNKTQFRNVNLLSTPPDSLGHKNGYAKYWMQFEDINLHIEIMDDNTIESDVTCKYVEVCKTTKAGKDTFRVEKLDHLYDTYNRKPKLVEDRIEIEYVGGIKNKPSCNLSFKGTKKGNKIEGTLYWTRDYKRDHDVPEVAFEMERRITIDGY